MPRHHASRFDTLLKYLSMPMCWTLRKCVGHYKYVSRNILCVAYLPCVCVSGLVGQTRDELVDNGRTTNSYQLN